MGIAPHSCSGKAEWFLFEFLQSSLALRLSLYAFTHHSSALPQACEKCNGKSSLCQGRCCTLKAPDLGGCGKRGRRLIFLGPFLIATSLHMMGMGFPKRGDAKKMSMGPLLRPPNFPQSKGVQAWGSSLPALKGIFCSSSLCSGCNSWQWTLLFE